MEAKNFRIGNFVNAGFKNEKKRSTHEMTGSCILDLYANAEKGVFKYDPIPLTDEWINKFGFDDAEYKKGYTGVEFRTNMILDFVLTKPEFMGKWQDYYAYDLGQHRFVPLNYVHQLQNLFFAITSTELTVKQEVSV